MSRSRIILLALACSLVVTSGAVSATIVGTARADVLRGTPRADRLNGKAGNDVLHGLQGDDVLNGGAGIDRFLCGAGHDVANAEFGERVAADCEIVRREPRSAPPSGSPAPTPPAPPPPPAPTALPGAYCGYTVQGPGLCITTSADGRAISAFKTSAIVDCQDGSRWTLWLEFTGRTILLRADMTFSFDYAGPISSDDPTADYQATYTIRGTLTTTGQASGVVAISNVAFTDEGTRYTCTQNSVGWSASRQ